MVVHYCHVMTHKVVDLQAQLLMITAPPSTTTTHYHEHIHGLHVHTVKPLNNGHFGTSLFWYSFTVIQKLSSKSKIKVKLYCHGPVGTTELVLYGGVKYIVSSIQSVLWEQFNCISTHSIYCNELIYSPHSLNKILYT